MYVSTSLLSEAQNITVSLAPLGFAVDCDGSSRERRGWNSPTVRREIRDLIGAASVDK